MTHAIALLFFANRTKQIDDIAGRDGEKHPQLYKNYTFFVLGSKKTLYGLALLAACAPLSASHICLYWESSQA